MSKKELSPYAPDRWIRELSRRYPCLWTDLRKGYADPGKLLHLKRSGLEQLSTVPDWCIMPTLFPFLAMVERYGEHFYLSHMDELMTMGSTYIWRCSKGVYRFAPELYDALIHQPLTGNLPQECLFRLPEWAVYVETPGLSYERIKAQSAILSSIFAAALDADKISANQAFLASAAIPELRATVISALEDKLTLKGSQILFEAGDTTAEGALSALSSRLTVSEDGLEQISTHMNEVDGTVDKVNSFFKFDLSDATARC